MPRRRQPDLGRRSQSNVRRATSRANRTDDQRETDRENSFIAMSQLRYLVVDRLRMQRVRAHQTQQQQARHNEIERIRRRSAPVILERAAFHYDPAIDYCADKSVTIGEMKIICEYCKALKYTGESTGLCCAGGKVKLPQLVLPPDPLRSLVSGIGNNSKHFLANIQKYNNCFQMTSFGATHIIHDNFMPTFKVLYQNIFYNIQVCTKIYISEIINGQIFKNYRYKDKFITYWGHCYHYLMQIINFYKFILWAIQMRKLIIVVLTIQQ